MYPLTDQTVITRRADNSFVLDGIYHLPGHMEEFAQEYARVLQIATDQPERVTNEPAPPRPTPEEELARARAAKLHEINLGCQAALAALTPTYPERELLTFDKQEAEARAYQANSGADVPLLSALAAGRGMAVEDLAARVLAKAEAFAVASGALIGQRQRMEDLLDNCDSVEAVRAIEVAYSLPGFEEAV